jgi:ribonucleoside-diphosphate reductase alpha chain
MACMTHRIVQMGGVRRASGISYSDLDDLLMRHAKRGSSWLNDHPHRNQANDSTVYEEKPSALDFMDEWLALGRSGSGERGIFNAGSLHLQIPSRRKKTRLRGNPCGEINLRNCQFCNLSIAVIRADDTKEEIRRKVIIAAIWGTLQASMTDYLYLRKLWKENSEEEALLGVDLLGHLDHPLLRPDCPDKWEREQFLDELRQLVISTNREWARKIGINTSAATTCGKPSGDSSVFFDTAAGFKPYHGRYYLRRIRLKANNPIVQVLKEAGVPHTKDYDKSGLLVFEIPARSPENAILLGDQTAIQQLENWLVYKIHWTEHNPSVTIYVKDHEWLEVGNWVYSHWDEIGGLSFFPFDDSVYPQAPYQTIDESEYNRLMKNFPTEIDWSRIVFHEDSDMTELSSQYACTGGKCDV